VRPRGAVVPELQDRGTRRSGVVVGIGGVAGAGAVGSLDEACDVVGEPAGEGVVGSVLLEFDEDAFT
jgi:hypothetical protein